MTLAELEARVAKKELQLEERKKRHTQLLQEVIRLQDETEILTLTDQALLTISTKLLGKSIGTIDKLVTNGMKAVFDDQKLAFEAKVERYRGKTSIQFELLHNGKRAPIMESYGGGILVLVGVLLRVATIVALGLRRLLVLDESLSHVSPQYVANVSRLLKRLATDLQFTILMISHDDEFASSADRHYQAHDSGQDGTTFKLLHPST